MNARRLLAILIGLSIFTWQTSTITSSRQQNPALAGRAIEVIEETTATTLIGVAIYCLWRKPFPRWVAQYLIIYGQSRGFIVFLFHPPYILKFWVLPASAGLLVAALSLMGVLEACRRARGEPEVEWWPAVVRRRKLESGS